MNIKDEIKYYLPTWSRNSHRHYRSAGELSELIAWSDSTEVKNHISRHCESLVERGDLIARHLGGTTYYAHSKQEERAGGVEQCSYPKCSCDGSYQCAAKSGPNWESRAFNIGSLEMREIRSYGIKQRETE